MLQEHKLQDINVAELEPKVLQIFNRACFGEHRASALKNHVTVCANDDMNKKLTEILRNSPISEQANVVSCKGAALCDANENTSSLSLCCPLLISLRHMLCLEKGQSVG